MILLCTYWTGQTPFKHLVITPTILDEKGRKMSKSVGNVLQPNETISKYSSDALRLGVLSGMIPGRNMRLGGGIADNLCEKYRNFGNKLWSVARFLEHYESQENEKAEPINNEQ
jgi:valyl-tRNA synthetase